MKANNQPNSNSAVSHNAVPHLSAALPHEYVEPHWYAAYTCARHEKRVAQQLQQRSIEVFLPLYEAAHRWKDRRKRVQLALFPSYVFVRIALKDRLRALQIPSVVRLVGFGVTPVPLEDGEVEGLRQAMALGVHAEPHPYLTVGRHVRLTYGPLAGLEGILLRRKGNCRVVLSIHLIQHSVAVDVDAHSVEPVFQSEKSAVR
jgi:transcription antitermination factor NusG